MAWCPGHRVVLTGEQGGSGHVERGHCFLVAGRGTAEGTVDAIAECPAVLLASFPISAGRSFWEARVAGGHEEGEGSEGSGASQMASLQAAGPPTGPQLLGTLASPQGGRGPVGGRGGEGPVAQIS